MMVKKLLILFVSISFGTLLAFFAVLFLQDYIVPVGCVVIFVIFGGWFSGSLEGVLREKVKKPLHLMTCDSLWIITFSP